MQRPKFSLDSLPSTAISSNLFSTWCHPSPVAFWSRKRKLWRPLLVLDPVQVILGVGAGLLALLNARPKIEGRRSSDVVMTSGTFGRDSQASRKWLKGVIGTFKYSPWSSCSFIGIYSSPCNCTNGSRTERRREGGTHAEEDEYIYTGQWLRGWLIRIHVLTCVIRIGSCKKGETAGNIGFKINGVFMHAWIIYEL